MALETIGPRSGAGPLTYMVVELGTFDPQSVFAHFDGTGAGGSFRPALTIRAQDGTILARVFPSTTLAAGDTADVTYAPFLDDDAAAAAAGATAFAAYELLAQTPIPNQGNPGPDAPFLTWAVIKETPGKIQLDNITPSNDIILLLEDGVYQAVLQTVVFAFNPLDFGGDWAVLEPHLFLSDGAGRFPVDVPSTFYADQNLNNTNPTIGITTTLPFRIAADGDWTVPGMLGALVYNYDNNYVNMINSIKTATRMSVFRLGDA
jgi:hypothetical protein